VVGRSGGRLSFKTAKRASVRCLAERETLLTKEKTLKTPLPAITLGSVYECSPSHYAFFPVAVFPASTGTT